MAGSSPDLQPASSSISPGLMTKRETHDSADFFRCEGFLNKTMCAEELGDIQKILVAGCPGHGYHSGVQKSLCQRERDFHPISLRHQHISDDEISGCVAIEHETCLAVCSF